MPQSTDITFYQNSDNTFDEWFPEWLVEQSTEYNEWEAHRAPEEFTTMPALHAVALTHPNGEQTYTPSISAGRLRVTADAGNTDNNLRMAYGLTRADLLGDAEIKATWHDTSIDFDESVGRFQAGHIHRLTTDKQILDQGVATGGTSTTLEDTNAVWAADEFHGDGAGLREVFVSIVGGTGLGQVRPVVDNGTGSLTVGSAWSIVPDNTTRYEVWTYLARGIAVMKGIVFGLHEYIQVVRWDGGCYEVWDSVDLGGYLNPGGTQVQFPWNVKTRLVGTQLDVAVWVGADPEPEYGAVGQSGTFVIPDGYNRPGMSGLYVGHLDAGDWVEFDNLQVLRSAA